MLRFIRIWCVRFINIVIFFSYEKGMPAHFVWSSNDVQYNIYHSFNHPLECLHPFSSFLFLIFFPLSTIISRFSLHQGTLEVVKLFPFVSSLQRMSVLARTDATSPITVYTKGAPEKIASLCDPETGRFQPYTPSNIVLYIMQKYNILVKERIYQIRKAEWITDSFYPVEWKQLIRTCKGHSHITAFLLKCLGYPHAKKKRNDNGNNFYLMFGSYYTWYLYLTTVL